ncbi:MAG TPA: hypothetical protein VFG69_14495 [Nannocystaceae bacterium]|nr:hypothetical protein [Nannocystaceae bacterium]
MRHRAFFLGGAFAPLRAGLVAGLLGAGACSDDAPPTPRVEAVPSKDGAPAAKPEAGAASGTTPTPVELAKASAAATIAAKSVQHVAFEIAQELHAIEGTASTPTWGAAGRGDATAVRDDDLGTAWTCEHGGATPCAIGLAFAEPASIRAVQIYAAAGPKWTEYRAYARPKKVRIHTDAGWLDVALDDGAAHRQVLFDKSVETRTLTLEVLDVHAGKKGSTLWIAELEAVGDKGPERPPLELDPARTIVSFETDPWKASGQNHTIRLAFLEEVSPAGKLRRVMRGTAIHGRASDRFLVVERLFKASCTTTDGSYSLLDRNTRMLVPLGAMAGVPAEVALRGDGLGVLFTSIADPTSARAAVLEEGKVERLRPSKKKAETPQQFAARLAFTDPAVRRGGHAPGAAPAGCKSGTSDPALVQRVATALALTDAPPADASICELEASHRAIVGTSSGCGARWYAAVIGPAGEIVAEQHATTDDGRGAWFGTAGALGVLFEATRDGGRTSNVLRLAPDGVHVLVEGGALAVRRPKICDPCAGDFGAVAEAIPPDASVADPEADDRGSPDGESPEARTTDEVPVEPPVDEEPPADEPPAKPDAPDGKGSLPTVTDDDPE